MPNQNVNPAKGKHAANDSIWRQLGKKPINALRKTKAAMKHKIYNNALVTRYGKFRHKSLLKKSKRYHDHHYTSFYRSPLQMEALTESVLSYFNQNNDPRELKIIVLGCSKGSEPFTIASTLVNQANDLQFKILASDLSEEIIEKAKSAEFDAEEIYADNRIDEKFINQTFLLKNGRYIVKPEIRSRITFGQLDIMDPEIEEKIGTADIVFAQNILFHLAPEKARKAFYSICKLLKDKSVLFLDGMELDMREELTKAAGLRPLEQNIKQIHEYARTHVPLAWWKYYWGAEPFSKNSPDYLHRFSTIFFK